MFWEILIRDYYVFYCVLLCCDNLIVSELGIIILCIYIVIVILKVVLYEVNFVKLKMVFLGFC